VWKEFATGGLIGRVKIEGIRTGGGEGRVSLRERSLLPFQRKKVTPQRSDHRDLLHNEPEKHEKKHAPGKTRSSTPPPTEKPHYLGLNPSGALLNP